MSRALPAKRRRNQPSEETREEKIARYGSSEFTQALTETFHRAKRRGIQADREAAKGKKHTAEDQP